MRNNGGETSDMIMLLYIMAGTISSLNDSTIIGVIENFHSVLPAISTTIITLLIGFWPGLLTGYYLQKRSFSIQAQIDAKNKREAAYSELLKDLASSQSTGVEPRDTSFHMFQVYINGSQEVRNEIGHLSDAEYSNPKPSLWIRAAKLQAIMIRELMEK